MDSQSSEETMASTSAATQKQSSPVDDASRFTDSPSSKEEQEVENEALEECSVCRNEMTDTTTLSDCVHEFCYSCVVQWLTKGTGPFCPMCKAPVKFIKRKGTDKEIPLEQIQLEKEPEATVSQDLVTERRIVARKIRECRRLMNHIDEIIGSASRLESDRRQARTKELNMMKQLCVAQLNALQMLRDDIGHGAAKALIVSRPEFRRLIYERASTIETSTYTEHRVTKEEFLADIEHYRSVLNAFLTVELKALPLSKQPLVDSQNKWYFRTVNDALEGKNEDVVNKLFCLIAERGVNELTAQDMVEAMEGMLTVRIATIFLSEIKSLVNSKKTFLDWCGEVLYRNNSDVQGGNGNVAAVSEYVTVDDSIEVDEPPTYDSRFEDARRRGFPVFGVPGNHFSGFFPDNRRPSSSDTDQDEDIYFQAPLRMRRNPNAFRPSHNPAFAIPRSGISWSDLTRTDNPPPRANLPSSSNDVVVVDLDDEEDNDRDVRSNGSSSSDDTDGIQVVDETIVLSDSPAVRVPAERKRKNNDCLGDLYKRSKYEELPEGLVEDVQKLITKYNMPMVQAMNMMVNAAQEAIKLNAATTPVNLLARNQNGPSTSSNLQPNDALLVATYLARAGKDTSTKNVPENLDW